MGERWSRPCCSQDLFGSAQGRPCALGPTGNGRPGNVAFDRPASLPHRRRKPTGTCGPHPACWRFRCCERSGTQWHQVRPNIPWCGLSSRGRDTPWPQPHAGAGSSRTAGRSRRAATQWKEGGVGMGWGGSRGVSWVVVRRTTRPKARVPRRCARALAARMRIPPPVPSSTAPANPVHRGEAVHGPYARVCP